MLELAEVMNDIVKRIMGLRAKFGTGTRIPIEKLDAKSTFRQISVDPAGAAAFGYVVADYIVVDMRLQFGWRGGAGWWGVVASAMQDAQRKTTRATAVFGGRDQNNIACKNRTFDGKKCGVVPDWP